MKKVLVVLLVPLLAFSTLHKFYVSVTHINYSEKNDSFQITMRLFIDDMEEVLKERYGIGAKLATDDETAIADEYLERYIRTKFLVYLDNERITYGFLGKKYDNDMVVCYIELPKADMGKLKTMEIENKILTDLFEAQKNVVHIKWKGRKKSFILTGTNAKGTLNF